MAIPLIKEPDEFRRERLGLEKCHFCSTSTPYWHENTNNPVCEECAKTHKVSELPDHGKNIRKNKRILNETKKLLENMKKETGISIRRLSNLIENIKKYLRNVEEKDGLYENFGQKEVSLLRDNFIDISSYSNDMNIKRDLIHAFDNWCMNYRRNF